MTYCWKCPDCGERRETHTLERPFCDNPTYSTLMVRDYRTEAVGIGPGVRISQDEFGGLRERAAAFLPTPDDFKGPGDEDGMKGLRAWRDEHEPTKGDVIGNMLPKTQF